jgi:LPXTG-motif cell wall-anchored protein
MAIGLGLLVLAPAPAGADPAKPGPYRSEVTGVDPEVDGVTVEVAGGDSFLELTVDRGVEVEVPGYEDEPYLRFLADGTVEENELSPSAYRNRGRYEDEAPPEADADAEPRWVEVAHDGTYAWHDHRIHWMSPDAPPRVQGGSGLVQEWEVPIVVDGQDVVVSGRLDKVAGTSPLPWLGLALVVGVGGWFLGRRRVAVAVPAMTVAGGLIATYVGWRDVASQPDAAGASPLPFVLGAVALALALVGAVLGVRHKAVAADLCGLASAAALGGWVLLRFSVLAEPVLPTDLAPNADRAGTALVLAFAVASAVLGVQGGAFGSRAAAEDDVAPASSGPTAPATG